MLKNQKFKEARKAAGFTQKEFAEKLGTNQAYVSALETRSNFSMETAIDLAKILKLDPKELMIDESGQKLEVDADQIKNNVLAFLKRKGIMITELLSNMNMSRTAFYYQLQSKNMKESFKEEFEKATKYNLMSIINEKQF